MIKTLTSFAILLCICLQILNPQSSFAMLINQKEQTPVDLAVLLPPPARGLSTNKVPIDADEKPFFDKLAPDAIVTGSLFSPYSMRDKKGNYVSWFGIVRKVDADSKTMKTKLTVQQCYSDGMSDTHALTISARGCGDFQVVADGDKLPILPLRAVRVYGVVDDYAGAVPIVKAEFIKEWDWGNFNFMNYGESGGNPEWTKLMTVDDKHVYTAYPQSDYYRKLLGSAATPGSIYSILTLDQCKKYVETAAPEYINIHYKIASPKFVGGTATLVNPAKGSDLPVVFTFREPEDFLMFKSGPEGAKKIVEKQALVGAAPGTPVDIVDYKMLDEIMSAMYKVTPKSGELKDQPLWVPGFALKQ